MASVALLGSAMVWPLASQAHESIFHIGHDKAHSASSTVATLYNRAKTHQPTATHAYSENLWNDIRSGFRLPELRSDYIAEYEESFSKHPENLKKTFKQARHYLPYIASRVKARGLPTEIALLPFVESSFDPYALSPAGAAGLWQFMPSTAKSFGLQIDWWYEGRRDLIASTEAALDYIEFLHEMFDQNWFHTLAAYNAGENRIVKAIEANSGRGASIEYSALRLSAETRRYIPKLVAIKNIVAQPEKFGIELLPMPNSPQFEVVDFGSHTDLRIVARIAGVSDRDLYRLNPALRRLATRPEGPHKILIPLDEVEIVRTAMNSADLSHRINHIAYEIQPGDYLGKIAEEFEVPQNAIVFANSLTSADRIRAGDVLMIPLVKAGLNPRTLEKFAEAVPYSRRYEHRVRAGETLWSIANRHDVRIAQLTKWNKINRTDFIRPNQIIIIYINQ